MLPKSQQNVFKHICSCCDWTQKFQRCFQMRRACKSNASELSIHKVLIANRGEVACRIIRTAKRMGIKTVAVYSVADSQAAHVQLADERVLIGPSSAIKSYLSIPNIMEAVRKTGADAVHPGYGFLSENSEFATVLESENVVFIGPSADVISRMGDKLESKRTALAAGVNVIPGFDGIVTDADHCIHIARAIEYPVMIKAAAGGGGKGMRVARNDLEVREVFLLCIQEAISSFGDNRMLVERYIDNPRHIEIQILGDRHGHVIHLNERECSIQRRNQKVIEEAPSVLLDEGKREDMGKQAVAFCKQLGYFSVGTVEFLMDRAKQFYFLEMNTRLQVEHPVTECITGIDLIEEMFRVANGFQLRMTQADVKINGWAIESRVYAEDPYRNFGLPCTGRIYKYQEPQHLLGVRCDSGVNEGSKINMHYDPLISKLICHANTREDAIQKSIEALDSYIIRGISHNIPILRDILSQPTFHEGSISANYLPDTYPEGFKGLSLKERDRSQLVAVAAALFVANELRSRSLINIPNFQIRVEEQDSWHLFINFDQEQLHVDVCQTNGQFRVDIAGSATFSIDKNDMKLSELIINPTVDGKTRVFQLLAKSAGGEYQIIYKGNLYTLYILSRKASKYLRLMPKKLHEDQVNEVRAPMSGLVKSVLCSEGDWVMKGQELLVIEAMKMQNFLVAPSYAHVKDVIVDVGDTVRNGETLIRLDC
ncbi:hypothetical protein HUJ04_005959 [Dendroctonus ponderosae]|uniref:propionyl-CoA carboxylase n=3 Tax=Dendroctonus ponderosae TaxID=77166 RepID=A0AAR5NYB5_DENPD|nr:hypothetical protein HUJ04_005959 [Dendroctonus ponderosae]KAH1002015.1 hypothetical protein HUJ04_005959 [Dendroctonus ponderosae]